MRLPKLVIALLVLFACFLDLPVGQAAYKCKGSGSPRQELENATAVFIGKVARINEDGPTRIVEFIVEKVWKGPSSKRLTVHTGKNLYGYGFTKTERYLIYAYGEKELETSRCSRTQSLELASLDLKELGEGKAPQ
jgi:hypothetical protein